jgi:hypothetical protein
MATSGSRNDPLASFNFIIKIENMELGFSEVGGLSTETNIIEYREGPDPAHPRKVPGQRKGGTITLLDEGRKPALVWEFSEGWPSKWNGPAMNAKNNDIAIEEMEIAVETLALQT